MRPESGLARSRRPSGPGWLLSPPGACPSVASSPIPGRRPRCSRWCSRCPPRCTGRPPQTQRPASLCCRWDYRRALCPSPGRGGPGASCGPWSGPARGIRCCSTLPSRRRPCGAVGVRCPRLRFITASIRASIPKRRRYAKGSRTRTGEGQPRT